MAIKTSEEGRALGSLPRRRVRKPCAFCQKDYLATTNPRARFCSDNCRAKAAQERKRKESVA